MSRPGEVNCFNSQMFEVAVLNAQDDSEKAVCSENGHIQEQVKSFYNQDVVNKERNLFFFISRGCWKDVGIIGRYFKWGMPAQLERQKIIF